MAHSLSPLTSLPKCHLPLQPSMIAICKLLLPFYPLYSYPSLALPDQFLLLSRVFSWLKCKLYVLSHFRHVWLFVMLLTVAHQAPLFMVFSRQEYWSGLPFPPPGALFHPRIKLVTLKSPALASRFFNMSTIWEARKLYKGKIFVLLFIVFLTFIKSLTHERYLKYLWNE